MPLLHRRKACRQKKMTKDFEVRLKTCREFDWKVQQAMKSFGNHPLSGEAHAVQPLSCFFLNHPADGEPDVNGMSLGEALASTRQGVYFTSIFSHFAFIGNQ